MHNSFMIKPVGNTVTTVLNKKFEDLFYIAIKMCFATPHLGYLAYFAISSVLTYDDGKSKSCLPCVVLFGL